jgi:hypothetical protein
LGFSDFDVAGLYIFIRKVFKSKLSFFNVLKKSLKKIKMNVDLIEIAAYISIGLLLYGFLMELSKPKQGAQKWVTLAFIILFMVIIGYFAWVYYKDQYKKVDKNGDVVINEDNSNDIVDSESEPEQTADFVQDSYKSQKREFVLVDGVANYDDGGQIVYEDFKDWYLSPEFLKKYTESIKDGLRIKKKRLLEVKRQFTADLKTIKGSGKPKDALASLLNKFEKTVDDSKILEETISQIDLLLGEIKKRETNLSIDTTRKGLISAITDKNNGIDSLVGRQDIKDQLVAKIYAFSQNPRIFLSNFQNMAIYGPSGVGKTKLAKVIGHVYSKCGILIRDHVHIITSQSLTTAYVNETGRMTRRLLLANLESVVFIDEAYGITPPANLLGESLDHGKDAVNEIVNFLDKMKGLSIIIVAGYEEKMKSQFFSANEGLPRRFPHILLLKPYQSKELTDILIKFLLVNCPNLKFNNQHGNYLFTIINYLNKENPKIFENQAGAMENLANSIATSIYSTPGKHWLNDYEELIFYGVNSYLAQNNISLEILE